MNKSDILEIAENLPDDGDVNIDELLDTLSFRRAVERGLAAADAGDDLSLEEFEDVTEQWLV